MAKIKKIDSLITQINTDFFDFKDSLNILVQKSKFKESEITYDEKIESINNKCQSLINKGLGSSYLQDQNSFKIIAFDKYNDFKRQDKNDLVYRMVNLNGNWSISTGLYCGVINFEDDKCNLCIKTNLSDQFFKRILNYCCGIYADTNTNSESEQNESIYSLIVQYLFLMSLRKVANKIIPKKYVTISERGYSLNGNIDINKFINNDLLMFDKKITYTYQKRLEIQSIIDVLYVALKECKINKGKENLPEMDRFANFISETYSGIRPSKKEINNVSKEKCLRNSIYSDFKKPLEYAKILLNSEDVNNGNNSKINGVSGFLVDSSFLWEMYLYNLMRMNLPDWDIESQSEISFYSDTFYSKNNYPDFVLRNRKNNNIFVLDAKFKRMKFEDIDVDNNDLRQLHAYSYYYSLTEKDNFKGAGLIYPTNIDKPDSVKNIDNIYGVYGASSKFGVFTVKDPDPTKNETITGNEQKFINELKEFLNS